MNNRISRIPNNVQNKHSEAWEKLCLYVEEVIKEGHEEFKPLKALGPLYSQIHTLPESIREMKEVKVVWLYSSLLKRIPPEIGQLESLENFLPYTSYDLNWFPYEITDCHNLKDSTISTRALYGNYKNRMDFPSLVHNPVRYDTEDLKCSICKKSISYRENNQLWISLRVGTDVVPLLVNSCSKTCENNLPLPAEGHLQYPHKGGIDLIQPEPRR